MYTMYTLYTVYTVYTLCTLYKYTVYGRLAGPKVQGGLGAATLSSEGSRGTLDILVFIGHCLRFHVLSKIQGLDILWHYIVA